MGRDELREHHDLRQLEANLKAGAAVSMIALLYGRGGFDLVLTVTAVVALGFVVGTALIAVLVNGVERERRVAQPAE